MPRECPHRCSRLAIDSDERPRLGIFQDLTDSLFDHMVDAGRATRGTHSPHLRLRLPKK